MRTLAGTAAVDRILTLDPGLFLVPAQLTKEDKVSLLAIASALHSCNVPYVYLEVGSHLGGSLQPYLHDPLCRRIYSIDKRPLSQPDARGRDCYYPENSTARMLQLLEQHHSVSLEKLTCIDGSTSEIRDDAILERPSFCFIDAEHTDQAVFRDFCFCLRVLGGQGLIGFHDAAVVARGILRCTQHLEEGGIEFRVAFLPGDIALLAIGSIEWLSYPSIARQAALNGPSILFSLAHLAEYRTKWYRLRGNPMVQLLAWMTRPLRRSFPRD